MSLLITDGMLRMALAAARSVGRRGVFVGVGEKTRFTSSAFSKYCKDRWVYPDPAEHPDLYYDSLLRQIELGKYRVMFPLDEVTLGVAYRKRSELGELLHLPLPPAESFRIAQDKGLSARLALEAGVDAPKTEFPGNLDEVPHLARKLNYPLVIKPRISSGSRGIRIVRDEAELVSTYGEIHRMYPYPVLQEYIPLGTRYGVGILYDGSGKLRAAYAHKEVHHFPYPMGPSSAVESVWMPELIERTKAIMDKLPWYGVAQLDFMTDPRDGIPKFMEINPRFWNSLQLSVQAGVDFPWLLYQLAVGNPIEDVFDYKIGQICRNLLPGELLHFVQNPDRLSMDPPLWAGPSKVKDDILSWSDPMPAFGFALACGANLFNRKLWNKLLKR
ncbi:ATP-grasp domain-containing protein [Paenibacillus hamazuiensis]|uniref:carboxylate--amine ligase n=1 Tax=Paenibacillus hamazuiensis TaxID=2936508 RepID=UPI00200DDBD2|nr:ATP-grasp domain-containing protein [Paenibacillus hamazuiensis]